MNRVFKFDSVSIDKGYSLSKSLWIMTFSTFYKNLIFWLNGLSILYEILSFYIVLDFNWMLKDFFESLWTLAILFFIQNLSMVC